MSSSAISLHDVVAEPFARRQQRDRARQRLAHADLGVAPRGAPERHELARDRHLGLERVVDRGVVDVGPVGDVHGIVVVPARLRYISSVMNGQNGASSCVIVMRHSCSVACAAGSDDFQKRGRERRTYQFDRSSTSSASACAPLSESNASSASVTVRTVRCSRDRIQRSRTCVRPAGAARRGRPSRRCSRT